MQSSSKEFVKLFRIADHYISINTPSQDFDIDLLLPSFKPFEINENAGASFLFKLEINDTLKPNLKRELVRECETGNGYTVVYQLEGGGYQYIIKDINRRNCCLLETNQNFSDCVCTIVGDSSMMAFGLNNALMLIYAFAGSFYDTLLIHASCPMISGYAYPFIAKSGTGKSTHSSLWLKNIPNTELLNDDNPVVRIIDGNPIVFGSPWSGKTPCYKNLSAKLGAVTRINRADSNYIEKLSPVKAFASFLPSCSAMKWDKVVYSNICDIITRIISTTPFYTMNCLPDDEAALVCYNELSRCQ